MIDSNSLSNHYTYLYNIENKVSDLAQTLLKLIVWFQSTRLREARLRNYNLLMNKEKTASFRYTAELDIKKEDLISKDKFKLI